MALFAMTVLVLLAGESALCVDYITYRLLPGSTITPKQGAQVTGPTENLSGTFQWFFVYNDTVRTAFDASYLHFESTSYTVNLNTTGLNDIMSNVRSDSDAVSFYEVVDITGLPNGYGVNLDATPWGWYSGPSNRPTYLNCQNIDIYPHNGGLFCGEMTLIAEEIPEPGTISLLGLGATALIRKRRA